MIATVKVSGRGTVTLPRSIRRQFVLNKNSVLIAEATDGGILLRPASVLPREVYTEKRLAEFERNNNRAIREFFPGRRKAESKP